MQQQREALLKTSLELSRLGLNRGTSGNVSVRAANEDGVAGFLITPSGMAVEDMRADDMVWMDFFGNYSATRKPSSEWRFHLDILQNKSQMHAVVHTHSMFATTLSTLRKGIPAFHYMVAVAGGEDIRCAPYALFGSQLLSDHALAALSNRQACLLANHGMIAIGETLEKALAIALEVETLAEQYLHALQLGEPHLLNHEEMHEVIDKFKGYGSWGK
jgi:L-fuculose-phosphate aldolase